MKGHIASMGETETIFLFLNDVRKELLEILCIDRPNINIYLKYVTYNIVQWICLV
jgi:hypothetical protein